MKRIAGFGLAAALALMPVAAFAASFHAGPDYTLAPQERVDGNLTVAAGTAMISGDVTGDLVITGGMVSIGGEVMGDVLAVGGTIQVNGVVDGDVRAMGGQVTVKGIVRGDVIAAGGTVTLASTGSVMGDVTIAGGELTIDGTVRGDVSARIGGRVNVGSSAHVFGSFDYRSPSEAQVAGGARIDGDVNYHGRAMHPGRTGAGVGAVAIGFVAMMMTLKMLAYLGFAALIIWRWRRQALELLESARNAFWPAAGHGVLFCILVPLCVVLLGISIIGIFPAVLLALVFAITMILTKALVGMYLGAWLWMKLKKKPALSLDWVSGLGGVVLLAVLGMIPFIGWIVSALISLALFGTMWHRIKKLLL